MLHLRLLRLLWNKFSDGDRWTRDVVVTGRRNIYGSIGIWRRLSQSMIHMWGQLLSIHWHGWELSGRVIGRIGRRIGVVSLIASVVGIRRSYDWQLGTSGRRRDEWLSSRFQSKRCLTSHRVGVIIGRGRGTRRGHFIGVTDIRIEILRRGRFWRSSTSTTTGSRIRVTALSVTLIISRSSTIVVHSHIIVILIRILVITRTTGFSSSSPAMCLWLTTTSS